MSERISRRGVLKTGIAAGALIGAGAAATLDMLDLHKPAFITPPPLAQPLAVTDPSALTCSTTGPGTIPPPGSITG